MEKISFLTDNSIYIIRYRKKMKKIENKTFGGERPLFGAHDICIEGITITDGESGIKCCNNIECHNSKFYGKYP